ncbi:MAG: hypothetical protein JSR18_10560 [Proteobacteria bacterium]|nr:hypothetical protein [Pseudomonadota bacterium]
MRVVPLCAAALLAAGCATTPAPLTAVDGMPLGAFLDDVRAQLREVHWHVRGPRQACGSDIVRELDLRDATVTLALDRLAQAEAGGSIKLVAVPLGPLGLNPTASVSALDKHAQSLTLKLVATGGTDVVDLDQAPVATSPLAATINAAIDGFMRGDSAAPCLALSALKLEIVVDVTRTADAGFKVVVPAVGAEGTRTLRSVNALTIAWDRVASNRLR